MTLLFQISRICSHRLCRFISRDGYQWFYKRTSRSDGLFTFLPFCSHSMMISNPCWLAICLVSGDGFFWLPVAIAFWLSPSVGSPGTRLFALNLFVCLLFDLLVVGSIKSAVRRKRPHYNRGHFVVVSVDSWSFPSGHSTRAVMIVTLIWLYSPLWRTMITSYWYPNLVLKYKENYFMTDYVLPYVENHLLTIAYCLFTLWMLATACSRVVLGRHYISDVLGGIVIGVLEAFVAHFCLHVPLKVSELQHAYLLARFGLYEEFFWRFFPGGWFSTNHHFREVNQAEQGLMWMDWSPRVTAPFSFRGGCYQFR